MLLLFLYVAHYAFNIEQSEQILMKSPHLLLSILGVKPTDTSDCQSKRFGKTFSATEALSVKTNPLQSQLNAHIKTLNCTDTFTVAA